MQLSSSGDNSASTHLALWKRGNHSFDVAEGQSNLFLATLKRILDEWAQAESEGHSRLNEYERGLARERQVDPRLKWFPLDFISNVVQHNPDRFREPR
jgi:hypothetical protein